MQRHKVSASKTSLSPGFGVVTKLGLSLAIAVFLGMGTAFAQDKSDDSPYPDLRPAGFLQSQFLAEHRAETSSKFLIKRARFGFTSRLQEDISVTIRAGGFEPPNGTPRFDNVFVDLDAHPLAQLRIGQFLVPFGIEGPDGVVSNPAIERSVAGRRLNDFTLFRDIGVQISGTRPPLSYALAVVNGAGANTAETIDSKDVLGRVGVNLGSAELGVSGHVGQRPPSGPATDNRRRVRFGADAQYQSDPLFLRAEYILLQEEVAAGDNRLAQGGYLLGGYRLSQNWEVIGRLDVHDPQSDLSDDRFFGVTIGPNYKFVGQTELAVNYELRTDETLPESQHRLLIQLQAVF